MSRTTDQNLSASFLCIPRWWFKEPAEQAAISPQNSNVNSFCQQIKPDLLDVSRALIPSILLASITLSEAVIIPCHSALCAGSTRSRIKHAEARVPCVGVNQELIPQELCLSWLTPKEISSGSGTQHQLGLAPQALHEAYFQRPLHRLQSLVMAGEQHSGPETRAGLTAVLIQQEPDVTRSGSAPLCRVPRDL